MEHYDGPSFYRKYFNGKLPFQEKKDALKPKTNLNNSAKLPPEPINHSKADVQPSRFKSSYQKVEAPGKQKEQDYIATGTSIRELIEQFQPSVKGSHVQRYYTLQNQLSPRYLLAVEELTDPANGLILLSGRPKPVSRTQKPQPAKIDFGLDEKKPASVEENQSDNQALIYENKNESAVDNFDKPHENANAHKELGHSLGDIFQEESGFAKNLSFFNEDRPEVKNVSQTQLKQEKLKETNNGNIYDSLASASKEMQNIEGNENVISEENATQHTDGYQLPSLSLLNPPVKDDEHGIDDWISQQAQTLDDTLKAFNVGAHVVDWTNGPTVTQFQLKLDLGVKVNKITNLNDDLKMALAAKDIRIEAPIPGKPTVGIEIPNPNPRPVMLSEILDSQEFRNKQNGIQVSLGMDIEGNSISTSLQKMPHALIAGATGSGKSVFINSLLLSLLYEVTPDELRMILIDPKAVELAPYNGIPHLLTPVISDSKEAAAALKWITKEMDERYDCLAAAGVRNIEQYNKKAKMNGEAQNKMPYILVVIDELADLMMVASTEVQDYIVRITQKARAAGIHMLVATQRPSVDIVTGTIKNNIPTRIAFGVSSQIDSRTIIDQSGAERLLGKGDMLYLGREASKPVRLQGAFVSNQEVDRVVSAVKSEGSPNYEFEPKSLAKSAEMAQSHDELWGDVLQFIAGEENVSTSKLQRVFSIGYNRSASIIDDLERSNFISGQHGSKPREVYLTKEAYQKLNI